MELTESKTIKFIRYKHVANVKISNWAYGLLVTYKVNEFDKNANRIQAKLFSNYTHIWNANSLGDQYG